jgi:hypothetical protein
MTPELPANSTTPRETEPGRWVRLSPDALDLEWAPAEYGPWSPVVDDFDAPEQRKKSQERKW